MRRAVSQACHRSGRRTSTWPESYLPQAPARRRRATGCLSRSPAGSTFIRQPTRQLREPSMSPHGPTPTAVGPARSPLSVPGTAAPRAAHVQLTSGTQETPSLNWSAIWDPEHLSLQASSSGSSVERRTMGLCLPRRLSAQLPGENGPFGAPRAAVRGRGSPGLLERREEVWPLLCDLRHVTAPFQFHRLPHPLCRKKRAGEDPRGASGYRWGGKAQRGAVSVSHCEAAQSPLSHHLPAAAPHLLLSLPQAVGEEQERE